MHLKISGKHSEVGSHDVMMIFILFYYGKLDCFLLESDKYC